MRVYFDLLGLERDNTRYLLIGSFIKLVYQLVGSHLFRAKWELKRDRAAEKLCSLLRVYPPPSARPLAVDHHAIGLVWHIGFTDIGRL
ncbi:MAG: hypothetical protein ACJAYU_000679 [Bradymonadia bacterium]|jgi:hypothetical protein